MFIVVLLSLFSATQADYASYHVHNFLNYSISPCDNFYRHVCSVSMPADQTVSRKSEQFWLDLAGKLNSRTLNNPVMYCLDGRWGTADTNTMNHRCFSNFDCLFDEFLYFFKLYEISVEKVDESLTFYSTHGATSNRNISQAAQATSRMIELLYNNSTEDDFEASVTSYVRLQDRLHVMQAINDNDLVALKQIYTLTDQLKQAILRKFKETSWMRVVNEFGFNILDQYATTLSEITVQTEFDGSDRNMTILRKINKSMNSKYFEHSKRETGCKWFDVHHSFFTTAVQLNDMAKTSDEEDIYARLSESLAYNAFNFVESNNIVILAPTFFPLLHNSSGTTMLAFAGNILGHELIHSFITDSLLDRSAEFKAAAKCLMDHYNRSCQLFAEGECVSGEKTFLEDAADVEGARAGYELLKKKLTTKQFKQFEYPDLEITRQQSFFYSLAMRSCTDREHMEDDEHSPNNIRVNALVSQMPEFSSAFGCQPNDTLYVHRDQQCILFGSKSPRRILRKVDNTTKNYNNYKFDTTTNILTTKRSFEEEHIPLDEL